MSNRIDFSRKGFQKLLQALPTIAKAEAGSFFAILVGSTIYSFAVMAFIVPFRFPDAGTTGIAILINYQFGISLPLQITIINIVLLAWAWRELSPRVVFWTIVAVGLIAGLMKAMEGISIIQTDQKLLVALIGGAIRGYGGAIALRSGLSMGGLDIVILYVQKKYGIEVGKFNFAVNMIILTVSIFIVGIENAMFGLVAVYASSSAIGNTISAYDRRRLVLVVTKEPQPIIDYVILSLSSGATVINAQGGFSKAPRPVVMCLLTRRQAVDLRRFLASQKDTDDFMVIADASEVVGRGFKP